MTSKAHEIQLYSGATIALFNIAHGCNAIALWISRISISYEVREVLGRVGTSFELSELSRGLRAEREGPGRGCCEK